MFGFWSILISFLSMLFLLCMCVSSHDITESLQNGETARKEGLLNKKKIRQSFAHLLNNIVQVNEQRVDAMKKLSQLQDYRFGKGHMRSGSEPKNIKDEVVALVLFEDFPDLTRSVSEHKEFNINEISNKGPYKHLRTKKLIDSTKQKVKDSVLNITGQELSTLRSKWRKTCDKAANKNCFKACKNAYKESCKEHRCSKSLKRTLKRECKRNCRRRFYDEKPDIYEYDDYE